MQYTVGLKNGKKKTSELQTLNAHDWEYSFFSISNSNYWNQRSLKNKKTLLSHLTQHVIIRREQNAVTKLAFRLNVHQSNNFKHSFRFHLFHSRFLSSPNSVHRNRYWWWFVCARFWLRFCSLLFCIRTQLKLIFLSYARCFFLHTQHASKSNQQKNGFECERNEFNPFLVLWMRIGDVFSYSFFVLLE